MLRALRVVLIVNAVIALANAAFALASPGLSLSAYGLVGGEEVDFMARFAAVGSVAIGLMALFASRMKPGSSLRGVVLALFVSDLVGLTVSAHGTLTGVMNAAGWGLVLPYSLFATVYGLFLLRGPDPS